MAKTKKKGSKAKNSKESNKSGVFILVLVLVVIAGVYFYGSNQSVQDLVKPTISTASEMKEQLTETFNDQAEVEPETKEKDVTTEVVTSEAPAKVEKTDLSAFDGKEEKSSRNENLPEYKTETNYYFTSSFDFAWPSYKQGDAVIEHVNYALQYNEKTEQADWVAYILKASDLRNARFKRNDNFRPDPLILTQSAHPDDYKGSGYDRGHLAPAADFTWDSRALDETFYMSNMSPQVPGFNRGIWRQLEEQVRKWAKKNGTVYVVTGPIFEKRPKKIGKNDVAIPSQYYKVILELEGPDVKGIGFVLDNEKSTERLSEYALSIDDVESLTGLDFFPLLPDNLESEIECCARFSDW